jgi:beta-galactosidase
VSAANGGEVQTPAASRSLANNPFVFDPQGKLAAYLQTHKVPFTRLDSLDHLPSSGKALLIGPDALSPTESASSRLAAYASAGRAVIVLDQANPLKYQGLPAEMAPVTGTVKNDFGQELPTGQGNVAFIEDAGHPAFRGLSQKDFFTWGPEGRVYRNAYVKPTRGGKSLVQCGPRLADTALAEIPAGKGVLLVCQLAMGEKLGKNAVADQLLANLMGYAASYRQEFRPVSVVAEDDPSLLKAVDAMGLQYAKGSDPLKAITLPGVKLALVSATPAHLKELASHLPQLNAFMRGGGYLVLHGLTPEGLADYNKIVGFEHMIRPFRRERVTFPAKRNPLTSGLTLGDVVMSSGERIFDWTADEYVADDVFSYIVDYDEVAPFGTWNSGFYYNLVNGMTDADAWKYIVNESSDHRDYILTLPKPQTIRSFTWVGNTNYNLTTGVDLIFDGNEVNKVSLHTQPNGEAQTFEVTPPRTGTVVDIRNAEFTDLPGKNHTIGADNVYLYAQRPAGFYQKVKPMLNIGGLMQYPRGEGGIVLCNLLFKDTEAVPANALKKRNIMATILRNLKAPFAGKTVIAGANLKYSSVDISKQANQYRNERGWFGDPNFTFKDLPTGHQVFAGVPFEIYDFPTSPVPTAIMLGGPGVPNHPAEEVKGIPVHRKADALFFLQAAQIASRRDAREVREGKRYEMARYVITYADGQTETVPIYSEIDVEDFKQEKPQAIPGAQLAWVKPYPGTNYSAVAYMKQWNNPRPSVAIQSVGVTYGPDRRGIPALLAVTAATAE